MGTGMPKNSIWPAIVTTIATLLGIALLVIGCKAMFDGHADMCMPLVYGGAAVVVSGACVHPLAAFYQEHNLPGMIMLFSMAIFAGFAISWLTAKPDDPRGPALINFMVGLIGFFTGVQFQKLTIRVQKGH